MSKKHDQFKQVRLDPQTVKKLQDRQKNLEFKASLSSMANTLIMKALALDERETTK